MALEPSCLAVFRDEMLDLRPHDQDAKRLHGQVFTLAEFLARHDDYKPPVLNRDLVVHGHCHQKAIISLDAEKKLFEAMGAKAEILDDGCCGMAGSFGFEHHKYDLSMQIYEHKLGPHLREIPPQRLVMADGFSCKTQIEQATGRLPVHLAQLLQIARHGEEAVNRYNDGFGDPEAIDNSRLIRNGLPLVVGLGAAFASWHLARRIFR